MIHHRRTTCRLCNSPDVELAFALEPCPLAEAYLPPERVGEGDARYPSDVFLCRSCGGVQMLDIIDAGHLFRDYGYTSSMSPDLSAHFARYAAAVCERFSPKPGSLVVDVGSNDGSLLRHFKDRGLTVCGVEPAWKLADKACEEEIPTTARFMDVSAARYIIGHFGKAAIVCANNVLAHAEEPGVIIDGVREVLADDGVFVFEVSYLPDLIDNLVFDYTYLEHGIMYTAGALASFLSGHGLQLFDMESVPTKGGSVRGFARKNGISGEVSESVYDHWEDEYRRGFTKTQVYTDFISRVNALRDQSQACLREYASRNLRVVGYGGSSTTTVLLHHFGIGGYLDCLIDDNEARRGLVSPGYHLPLKSPEEVLYGPNPPDAVFLCAWRFADVIMKRHKAYKGVWLIPLPIFREVAT